MGIEDGGQAFAEVPVEHRTLVMAMRAALTECNVVLWIFPKREMTYRLCYSETPVCNVFQDDSERTDCAKFRLITGIQT
jgi:hypothetical protein